MEQLPFSSVLIFRERSALLSWWFSPYRESQAGVAKVNAALGLAGMSGKTQCHRVASPPAPAAGALCPHAALQGWPGVGFVVSYSFTACNNVLAI